MKNIILIFISMTFCMSCGTTSEKVSVPDSFNSETIISKQNKLQKILTKEIVAGVVNVPADKIEAHVESNINQQGQYTVLYSWPSGHTLKVGDGKHEIAEYHSISIGFVQQMQLADFEKYYGTNESLQERVNQMTQQENFNKEVGIAEAKYIAEYARKRKTEKLDKVATMAFWETPIHALHVLAKDASFTITANFGNDETLAKEAAVGLVNTILNPKK